MLRLDESITPSNFIFGDGASMRNCEIGRLRGSVVLVSMPFMDVLRPSIQLGLLKSVALTHGFPASTLHANLRFAKKIGIDYYQQLSRHRGHMIGDWLFSLAAFRDEAPDQDSRMVEEMADDLSYLDISPEKLRERLTRIRHLEVPEYLDELVDTFPWREAAVVGFSSTFQQNTASFALARRLKERYPNIFIIFGGANFDGDMGLEFMRVLDYVDAAVIGEADDAFPNLLNALAAGADPSSIPGVARRLGGQVKVTPPVPPTTGLDDLPIPDYDEYFKLAEEVGILSHAGRRTLWLPVETARGCWWGAKHHCTFCGLNATAMHFRSKSPPRVLDEFAQLARRYRSFRIAAVDNIIDPAYLKDLFPVLAATETGYEIFYEVKANLSREQLRLMAKAGVTHIQPGIESLSSNVLRLMRKGVRAVQNVNLLRWSHYYGIHVSWNLLWGFPGETQQDYADQAAVIPDLIHLPPPSAASRIWLERFSPLFTGHDTTPLRNAAPERSYRYIYPESIELNKVAYFFDYAPESDVPDEAYAHVGRAVAKWSDSWAAGNQPTLKHWAAPHFVQVCDGRHQGKDGTYTLQDTLADLYLACVDKPTTAAAVRRKLGLHLPAEAVWEIFEEFAQRGLMFLDGQFALALALPAVGSR